MADSGKTRINLRYFDATSHPAGNGVGNFGDELSLYIVPRLLGQGFSLSLNSALESESVATNIVAIGSWIHAAPSGAHIWGSGIRTWPQIEEPSASILANAKSFKVHALRGPLTKDILAGLGANCSDIALGDPALLLPEFYKPSKHQEEIEALIIPNMSSFSFFESAHLPPGYKLLSPFTPWPSIVDAICSARRVISSSLHGLVLSDAYGVPNAWLVRPSLPEGYLKFLDYFATQNRPIEYIESIGESSGFAKFFDQGNIVDLKALSDSFPFLNSHQNTGTSPPVGMSSAPRTLESKNNWHLETILKIEAERVWLCNLLKNEYDDLSAISANANRIGNVQHASAQLEAEFENVKLGMTLIRLEHMLGDAARKNDELERRVATGKEQALRSMLARKAIRTRLSNLSAMTKDLTVDLENREVS